MAYATVYSAIRQRGQSQKSEGGGQRSDLRPPISDLRPLTSGPERTVREQTGKPICHLSTWRHDKEQLARKRQEQTGIETGLIGAWSCQESSWSYRATYCWITGNSANVLRYLGRPLTAAGKPHARCANEVMSRVLDFHDGLRVRHWVDHNSVKVYNEQNVLRIETTINMPGMFRVHRRAQGEPPTTRKKLRALRKGVADIALRAQVSQEVNNRLMDSLSTFNDKTPLTELLSPFVRPRIQQGRRVRALDLSGKDRQLLQAIADPSFTVAGITNVGLRKLLGNTSWGAGRTDAQLSARISRHLRLLRDHGLIRKAPNRHRYHLTDKGRQLTTALNAMLAASTEELLKMAA